LEEEEEEEEEEERRRNLRQFLWCCLGRKKEAV
jgi:hypothetical protein